jgi:hypothetical protein
MSGTRTCETFRVAEWGVAGSRPTWMEAQLSLLIYLYLDLNVVITVFFLLALN